MNQKLKSIGEYIHAIAGIPFVLIGIVGGFIYSWIAVGAWVGSGAMHREQQKQKD